MDNKNSITVSVYYSDNGEDVIDIIKKSFWLFIEREVKELCMQKS